MSEHRTPAELAGQPVVVTLPVQWGDQDAFGHVNGVMYFRWFETARVEYLNRSGLRHLMSQEGLGPILAAIKCDYRRQLKHPVVDCDGHWLETPSVLGEYLKDVAGPEMVDKYFQGRDRGRTKIPGYASN